MDVFIEHLVKKRPTGKDIFLKALIILGVLVVALLAFTVGLFYIGALSVFLVAGAIYGAWWLLTGMNIEYEYCVTNGDMDVDKIVAQRKRKRLLSLDCRTVEEIGIYIPAAHEHRNYDTRIYACESEKDEGSYYLVFRHNTLHNTLLVFNPSQRVLNGMMPYLPKPLAYQLNKSLQEAASAEEEEQAE